MIGTKHGNQWKHYQNGRHFQDGCHIAPAKPNGPIPFDLNDKRWKSLRPQIFYFCYIFHTVSIPLTTSSYQPVSPCWLFPRPGLTGWLLAPYRPERPHTVRSALLTSHTVYKSWALTRPVTLQFSIFFCTYSSSFFSKFFIILIIHNSS